MILCYSRETRLLHNSLCALAVCRSAYSMQHYLCVSLQTCRILEHITAPALFHVCVFKFPGSAVGLALVKHGISLRRHLNMKEMTNGWTPAEILHLLYWSSDKWITVCFCLYKIDKNKLHMFWALLYSKRHCYYGRGLALLTHYCMNERVKREGDTVTVLCHKVAAQQHGGCCKWRRVHANCIFSQA